MIVVGIDTGSADMGNVALDADDAGTVQRLACQTIDVREHSRAGDMRPAVAVAMAWIQACAADYVVIERSDLYTPPRANGQSEPAYRAMLASMSRAWALTDELARSIAHACADLPAPIHGSFVPRQTWAHRLVRHHRGGVTDADVREALPLYLAPDLIATLHTKHEIDALGAALWHVLPEIKRGQASRSTVTPEERAERQARKEWFAPDARLGRLVAAGCSCPRLVTPGEHRGGRHRDGCPAIGAYSSPPAKPPGDRAERVVEVMRTHARPIRLDVLAVRLALPSSTLTPTLRHLLTAGTILRPASGLYALPK